MIVNLIITKRGRDERLPVCLHYLAAANAARQHDVTLYLVDDGPATPFDPNGWPELRLELLHLAPAAEQFPKAALINAAMAAMRPDWHWCAIVDLDMVYRPEYLEIVARYIGAGFVQLLGRSLDRAQTQAVLAAQPAYPTIETWACSLFPSPSQIAFSPAWLQRYRAVFGPTLFDERFVGWGYEDTLPDVAASLLARARLAGKVIVEDVWHHLHHPPTPRQQSTAHNLALAVELHSEQQRRIAELVRTRLPQPHRQQLQRGATALAAGRLDAAIQALELALEHGPSGEARQLLAIALSQRGEHARAADELRTALADDPSDPVLLINLGEVERRRAQLDAAENCFGRALELYPYAPEAYHNLGLVWRERGRHGQAARHFQRATQLRPGYAEAHYNHGNALRELGQFAQAERAYRSALACRPSYAEAMANLGALHLEQRALAQALAASEQAIAWQPSLVEAHRNRFRALEGQGRVEQARRAGAAALKLAPDDDLLRLQLETLMAPIATSAAAIEQERAQLAACLARWVECGLRFDPSQAHEGVAPPFSLIYHGQNDRPLKQAFATLFEDCIRAEPPRPAAGPPRIGFVVTEGHEGVFLKCMRGLLLQLPPSLRVLVFCGGRRATPLVRAAFAGSTIEVIPLSSRLDQAVATLRAARTHLLYHWEIGTDTSNYLLPFFRTAPVQCAGWGWPTTSGIAAVDYFLSSAALEPPDAASHYSERLVCLASLPSSYSRPPVPAHPPSRARYGLSKQDHVYLCAQNLRKLHPDFDPLVAGILRADPHAIVALLADREPQLTAALASRMRQAMPDVAARLRLLPRLQAAEYLGLVASADLVLDPPHYGGGANTTYDALAAGTPIVTLPGRFHRGRWASAACLSIGLTEGIAANPSDYVARAVALGSDRAYRAAVSARIRAEAPALFARPEPAHELAQFIAQVCA